MKSLRCFLLATFCLAIAHADAAAQATAIPVTGFNADLVADGARPASDPASTTAGTNGGLDNGLFVFIDGTYQYSATCSTYTAGVLPATNQISSGTAAPGLTYNLQPYTTLNALRLPASGNGATGTGTLTLVTPTAMSRLYLLMVAGNGPIASGITVSVTFTDATTQTLVTNGSVGDWCSTASAANSTAIPQQYSRMDAAVAGTCGGTPGLCPYLHEMSLPVSGSKPVASVTISKTVPAGVFSVFAVGAQPFCAAPSAQPTALSQVSNSINSITGSFTDATTVPAGYLVVRYPSGAAVTAPADGVSYATGAALGAGTVVQSGSSTTFTANGLAGSTAYDFYVYSYTATAANGSCGGPVYLTSSPLMATISTASCSGGIAGGAYSVGPTGTYTSLTQALAAINAIGVAGPVVLELQVAYTSAAPVENFPITLTNSGCISATRNVVIRPEAGASNLLITSSGTVPTVDIAGGSFFTIDGRPGGVGATSELTIQNTNTGGNALRFINEAMKNRITYCSIQGVNTTNTGGVVQFSTTSGVNGNDSNAITYCNISGAGMATPTTLIYSSGSIGTTAQYNNNDTVANCNLYNFFNATGESNGFKLGNGNGGNANWAILDNSFYQTAARTVTGGSTQYALNLNCPLSSGYVISGNYIGGSAPMCGATPWTVGATGTTTTTGNPRFIGTYINASATGAEMLVSNNTYANFSWTATTTATNTGAPGTWGGIQFIGGAVAVTGNTIGSTSASSIAVTTNANGSVYGIFGNSGQTSTYPVTGNTIAGITNTTTGAATTLANIHGISVSAGTSTAASTTYNISGNTIGGSVANSLVALKASTGAQIVRGIEVTAGGARMNVTGNTVQNLTNSAVGTGNAQVVGISTANGLDSVAGNTVMALTNSAQQTTLGTTSAVIGISQTSTVAGVSVIGNTVSRLHSSVTANNANVVGIQHTSSASGINVVGRNLIHSLTSTSTAATGTNLTGILVTGGASTVQNNMVRLGLDNSGADITAGYGVHGIYETGGIANSYFHNSVYIGGAGVTSATGTHGFYSSVTSGTRNILNNIFYNARSNGSGSAVNAGIRLATTTGATSNGNVILASGSGAQFGILGATNHATIGAWQSATGQDAVSASADPQFIAPAAAATALDLHINPSVPTPVEGTGVGGAASVTDDFDAQSRAGLTPVDIGADAGNFLPLDLVAPAITYTPLASGYNNGNQTFTATITDLSGVSTSGSLMPRVYFRKNAGAYVSAAGSLNSGTAQNGTWNFTIDAAALGGLTGGDSVYYFVVAQDVAATPNVGSGPAGVVASDVNTITTPPTPNAYRVLAYLSGVIPVGAGQTVTSLTNDGGLFQLIAANGLSGNVTAVVSSDLAEAGTHALTPYAETGVGGYTVNIVPDAATERVISGAAVSPGLIRFSGVRGAKIDGSFAGSGRYLRLRNTNGGGSTVVYINDAKLDTVMNCIVEGNNTSTGNICFRDAISTGCDSNVVTGNVVRDLTNTAGLTNTGISSTLATAAASHSDNVISNNEFVNCIFNGLNLNPTATGDNWQITNNAFYYTQSPLTSSGMGIILVSSGSGHLISGNSIGGSMPDRSGAILNNTTTGTVNAIQLAVGTAAPTVVSGNFISNIASGGPFNGINSASGTVTISNNTIGGTQAYDTIRSAGTARTSGIHVAAGTAMVSGNSVSIILSTNTGTASTTGLYGISISGGSGHTVSSNTISNIAHKNTGTSAYFVGGIVASAGTSSTYSRNRVYNVYASGSGTGTSAPQVYGLYVSGASTENVINNQFAIGANTVNQTRVYGIQDAGGTGGTHNYFNNAVYVSGATSTGANHSYAFQRTSTTTAVLRNNILFNDRTTGGTGFNYALGSSSATGYTPGIAANNLMEVPDATRLVEVPSNTGLGIGAYDASFATAGVANSNWMADVATVSSTALFTDVTGGNLAVIPSNSESWYAAGKGLPLPTVSADFNNVPRATTVAGGSTSIGSTEFVPTALPPSATESAPPAAGTTNFYTFGGRTIARFTWDAAGTPPSLDVKLYSGETAPNTGGAPAFNSYYDITATGGSGYGYTIDLAYDSSMLGTVPNSADARLAKYDAPGPWQQLPGSSASPQTGFLSSNTVLNSFSLFTGGSDAVPLPVRALALTATPDGDVVRLDWTVEEVATGGRFALQRSADGIRFEDLKTLAAVAKTTSYNAADTRPLSGTAYYRVRLTEVSGAVRSSAVVRLYRSGTDGGFALRVSPNPITDAARVLLTGEVSADAQLTVTDLTGRVVLTQPAVRGEAVLDMKALPAGTYVLQLKGTGRNEWLKLVKQ